MENISENLISLEEAKAALKCMRLSGLDEEEALESLDELVERVRKVTTANLVENIIKTKLTAVQRECMEKYLYENKNTAQIARECGVSQGCVYRTVERAKEIIKELMTCVVEYQHDLIGVEVEPITREALKICAAKNSNSTSLSEELRNCRIVQALSPECLARALKISTKELDEIENGRRVPSVQTVMRYTALYNLKIKMTFKNGRGTYEWERA